MAPNSVTISTDKANDFTLLQVHDLDSPIFQKKQKISNTKFCPCYNISNGSNIKNRASETE